MKATIRHMQHSFIGKLGIVFVSVGMIIFEYAPWVMALGLGLLIGDTIEVTVEKEEGIDA